MIRIASQDEIRNVIAPLWLLINQTSWSRNLGEFDIIKNGASTILAHLAYCAINADEKERRNRAEVIPCRVYQDLILGEDFDLDTGNSRQGRLSAHRDCATNFLSRSLFPSERSSAIGVRGTQFAHDWLINLRAAKAREPNGKSFHAGFLSEARELAAAIRECCLRAGHRNLFLGVIHSAAQLPL